MIATQTCHTLICDECHCVLDNGEDIVMHFDDVNEARNEAEQYFDWARDGERDLCPQCTAIATCNRNGHQPCPSYDGGIFCKRCDETLTSTLSAVPNEAYL